MSGTREQSPTRQHLHPFFTTWHITFGTHAARLHGGPRITVDRQYNKPGDQFIHRDEDRYEREQSRLSSPPVTLSVEQCKFIEDVLPSICDRGGWILRTCSASPPPIDNGDHVHILLDSAPEAPPKVIRELIKRWLTQALNDKYRESDPTRPRTDHADGPDTNPHKPWWAEGGSTKPVKDEDYLNNAFNYIKRQRATPRS